MTQPDLDPTSYLEPIQKPYAKVIVSLDVVLLAFILFAADYLLKIDFRLGITTILHAANIVTGVYLIRKPGLILGFFVMIAYMAFRFYINHYSIYYVLVQGTIIYAVIIVVFRTLNQIDLLHSQTKSDLAELQIKESIILENQRNYLRLFNSIEDALWLVEKDWTIFFINDTVRSYLSLPQKEIVGRSLLDFYGTSQESTLRDFSEVISDARHYSQLPINHGNACTQGLEFETRISTVTWDKRQLYFVLSHDVTDRIRVQNQLKSSEEKFSKAFYLSPAMMSISTLEDGRMLDVNQSFLKATGFSREEVIGKTTIDLNIFANVAERSQFMDLIIKHNRIENLEIMLNSKQGNIISGLISAESLIFGDTKCLLSVILDLTESKKLNSVLINQSRILYGLSYSSNFLLTSIDFNKGIESALGIMCRSLLSDGILLYAYDKEADTFNLYKFYDGTTHHGKECHCKLVQSFSLPPDLIQLLSQGHIIHELSPNAPQINFIDEGGAIPKSFFISPIRVNNGLWGFGIYVYMDDTRTWSKGDEVILLALANSIGGAIERDHTLKQLTLAKEEAIQAVKAKSSFLAMMSHEIRTPMNAILGMANLLKNANLSSELNDYIDSIRISGDTLLDLINDILDYSKTESGYLSLDHHPFDLNTCLEDVLELLSVKAAEKDLELIYLPDFKLKTQIYGDSFRIRQVLLNLIGNAIKFTHEGTVVIEVIETQTEISEDDSIGICIEVKDTGIGIEQKFIDRIFQPFAQADSTISNKYGGTGLGLSISRRLANMMDGDITAESIPGRGSTFRFDFVAKRLNDIPLPKVNTEGLSKRKIFIKYDNPDVFKALKKLVSESGAQVEQVSSPQDIVSFLEKGVVFDLGFVDCSLSPFVSSDQLKLFRSIPQYKNTQIIFFRTIGKKSLEATEQENPLNHFINKPIKPIELLSLANSIFVGDRTAPSRSKTALFDANMAKLHPHTILVAEDNKINQKLLFSILNKNGYDADLAMTGSEVIDFVKRRDYDIVLMDFIMPVMNGLEASATIRRLPLAKQPVIIAMTANASDEDRQKATEAGMNHFLSKPIDFSELLSILSK